MKFKEYDADPGLTNVLWNVTTGKPTTMVQSGSSGLSLEDFVHRTAMLTSSGTPDMVNSSLRGNNSFVPEEDHHGDSSSWLSVRLVVIACILVGLVLMTLTSYYVHRKCCPAKDRHSLKYQKTTLML